MKLYFRLLRFIKPHIRILALAVIFMFASALFDSISLGMLVPLSDKVLSQRQIIFNKQLPEFLSRLIETINNTSALAMLNIIVISIFIIFILKGIFFFGRSYFITKLSQIVIRDIRDKLYWKIQRLSLEYFTQSTTGHLVSRITYDVEIIKGAISVGFTDLIYQSLLIVFLSFIVFFINWKWSLISVGLLPIIVFPIMRVGRMVKKISTQAQEKMADLNRKLFETITGIRIVKAFSMEESEVQKVADQNNGFYKIMMRLQKRAIILGPFTEFIGAVGGALVLYYGGREVISGRISFGIFILFLSTLLSLIRPCRRLSEIHTINQQAMAAAKRIFEILDAPVKVVESKKAVDISPFEREIVFKNVNFGYDNKIILKNLNLRIKKGEIIALVGPSGVGKTSLVNLIPRFYDPRSGKIEIDGVDVKVVTFKSLRRQIGIVTQDTILFNDTVRNNIAYSKEEATDEEVRQAAIAAEAHDFISDLSHGYDTIIGDMGIKLSGGQKQRLAIARAILNNPLILILDEATSQLDAESTRLVQEALDRMLINRTAIIIAHRLSTVKRATRILVLDQGQVIEQGTHKELMDADGLYKRLYELEFIT